MGDIKIFKGYLKDLILNYNLKTFVETGTLYGDAVQHAIEQGFEQIHSIEIMPTLRDKACSRFAKNDNVTIHLGHSADVLEDLLPKIETNTFFWLDAHFPGADSHEKSYDEETDEKKRIPLESEINLISRRRCIYKDVILIDDLWLYEDGPFEWGSFDEHNRNLGRNITRLQITGGKTSEFLYKAFKDTHDVTKFHYHQGYLVFLPK